MRREDGSCKIVNNIYAKNIDLDTLGKKQQKRPNTRGLKKSKEDQSVIAAEEKIINDVAKDDTDVQVLEILNRYMTDMMQHSYNALIEELFSQILAPHARLEENDKLYLLKLQTFMIEVCRLQA